MTISATVCACAIVFEPSDLQLHVLTNQLLSVVAARCIILDNSDSLAARARARRICAETDIEYLGGVGNLGTGEGLNRLLDAAWAAGDSWMLYLDQDSELLDGHVPALGLYLKDLTLLPIVAAIGSRLLHRGETARSAKVRPRLESVTYLIASGTLYNVSVATKLGGFDASMFLDTVDHEFCLRARRAGLVLLTDNARGITHEIGSASRLVSARFDFRVTRHPIWRRQLMWRNTVVLVRRYFLPFPVACVRHLLVRIVETTVSSCVQREPALLVAAVRGIRAGLRAGDADPSRESPKRWV